MTRFMARNGILEKYVSTPGNKSYVHRCPVKGLLEVVRTVMDNGGEFNLKQVKQKLPTWPDSQVSVAFDFLLYHNIIRRITKSVKGPCLVAKEHPWEEALEHYHYLEHVSSGGESDKLSEEELAKHIIVRRGV